MVGPLNASLAVKLGKGPCQAVTCRVLLEYDAGCGMAFHSEAIPSDTPVRFIVLSVAELTGKRDADGCTRVEMTRILLHRSPA